MNTDNNKYKGSSPTTTGILGAAGGALVGNIAMSGIKLIGNEKNSDFIDKMKQSSTSKPALIATAIAAAGFGGHQYFKAKSAIHQHEELAGQAEKLQASNQLHEAQANYADKFSSPPNNSHGERITNEEPSEKEVY